MQTPWKVIAAFIGVFIAGSVFGGFFALRVDRDRGRGPQKRVEQPQPLGPLTLRLMRSYADRLELTLEQKEKLRPVMERAGEDIRRVQQSQFREMGVLIERLQADVAQVLTPEQKVKLEAMKQQQRERMKGDRERGGAAQELRGDLPPGTSRKERRGDGTVAPPPKSSP